MKKKVVFVSTGVVVVGGLLALLAVGQWVWIPDIMFPRERQVASLEVNGDEYIELTEMWNGNDGYLLKLKHHLPGDRVASIILDGDSLKNWNSEIVRETDQFKIIIRGGRYGLYNPSTYSCDDGKHSRHAYIIHE